MTTMYDSTVAADIPEDAEAVAGYVNGASSAWSDADFGRFPNATVKRRISTTAEENVGDTLDVEYLDATPAQAPGWIAKRVASGIAEADLWLYVERSKWDALRAAVGAFAGGYWVADWTGEEHDVEGAVATQWASPSVPPAGGIGHYDLSHIAEPAPAPAPEPPGPAPAPGGGGADVQLPELAEGSSGDAVKTWQSILNGRGGAGLAVDGIFGPATKTATQHWQDVFHLAADGIVGPQTWASAFA